MKELETNSRAVLAGIRNAFGLPALLLFSAMTGFGSFAQEQGLSLYMSMLSTILIWGLPGQVVHAILNSNIVLLLEKLHNFYWIVQILLHEFRII